MELEAAEASEVSGGNPEQLSGLCPQFAQLIIRAGLGLDQSSQNFSQESLSDPCPCFKAAPLRFPLSSTEMSPGEGGFARAVNQSEASSEGHQ